MAKREQLKTETNTPEMGDEVIRAFYLSDNFDEDEADEDDYEAAFEHGQWWVLRKSTGESWSVVDVEGKTAIKGFGFEAL